MKPLVLATAVACACVQGTGHAESNLATSPGSNATAQANLDFTIVVPAVLSLRVGGTSGVNLLKSTYPSSVLFTSPHALATTGGDAGSNNSELTFRVFSNLGTGVQLDCFVSGPLRNPVNAAAKIAWDRFVIGVSAIAPATPGYRTLTSVPMPNPSSSGGYSPAPVTLPPVSNLVQYEGLLGIYYSKTTDYVGGTYTGRITYMATQL